MALDSVSHLDLDGFEDASQDVKMLRDRLADAFLDERIIQKAIDENESDSDTDFVSLLNNLVKEADNVTFNSNDLPSTAEFKADGNKGNITWTYDNFRVSTIEIEYPVGESLYRYNVTWENAWRLSSVTIEKYQDD